MDRPIFSHWRSKLAGLLYQENKILKITDFIIYKSILFVRNSSSCQQNVYYVQSYTRVAIICQVRTAHFGESSLKFKASQTWNDLQTNFNSDILTYILNWKTKKSCISRHCQTLLLHQLFFRVSIPIPSTLQLISIEAVMVCYPILLRNVFIREWSNN